MADPSDRTADRLFVYGTLKRGGRASELLDSVRAALVGIGRVPGRLVDLGSYPGLLPADGHGSWVRGELYELPEPASALASLDAYEGCGPTDPAPHEFERRACVVACEDGMDREAWAYFYRGDVGSARDIPTGEWRG